MNVPVFVNRIIARLQKSGFLAYIVGGAVRDSLLNRVVTDWDIATSASPAEINSLFQDIKHFALKHETVTMVHGDRSYEITSMRFSKNASYKIESDLSHRDFTINAMAYDVNSKTVIDPYNGKGDMALKIVRAVASPEKRFIEDPLRLLRAVRISEDLGFSIEPATRDCIQRKSFLLSNVSQERIRDEFMLILMGGKPSRGFSLLRRYGLLNHFIPELLEGYLKKTEPLS